MFSVEAGAVGQDRVHSPQPVDFLWLVVWESPDASEW